MFEIYEYTNRGYIFTGVIIIILALFLMVLSSGKAQAENKKVPFPFFPLLSIVFVISFPLYDGYTTKNTLLENIKLYKNNSTLRCSTLTSTYLVSKDTGWNKF
ncbi:hypothetical protein JHD48_07765 [Sulfurimonas sp. SAG-AH-194-I05]|nr:hypothetical protein [Sulfurimonas sp. SAG-AH-194-I05]MDF1875627.1 hypothetical protein [Sulfurimonas sp. SAG-AH-194-I05]